jgi:D-serine dehydratase
MNKFKKLYAELEKRMDENLEVARRCPGCGSEYRALEDNDTLALMDRMIEEEEEYANDDLEKAICEFISHINIPITSTITKLHIEEYLRKFANLGYSMGFNAANKKNK